MKLNRVSVNAACEIFGRILLLLLYMRLLHKHGAAFLEYHKISSLLYIVMEALIVLFILMRKSAVRFSAAPIDWVAALLGTLVPMLIIPTSNPDSIPILVLQCVGMAITIAGILALNRSFGIVAAEREIKTGGMYRFIRHPLYAGYTLSNIAILLNQYDVGNLVYVVAALALQIIRILLEEKFLIQNPAYARFTQTTRWRLVPGIW
jgi:protein-S-isoprenylcysteine O-methyltransferase Ste14